MPIREIGVVSFRNHSEIKLKFCPHINVIWGKNGSGKTAILEAIYTLSIGRSFRTNLHRELLKDGSDYLSISGLFTHRKKEQPIQLNQTKDGKRRFFIDGAKVEKLKELVGLNPIVVLSPEEQIITKGAPSDQRSYFDKLFSIVSADYLALLSEYKRTLKQRNKLLGIFNGSGVAQGDFQVWNEKLAQSGFDLWCKRIELFEKYNVDLQTAVDEFDHDFSFTGELKTKCPEDMGKYIGVLNTGLQQDIYLGRTLFGPHTDRIDFLFKNRNLKKYGSQGEHKLALLLIKLGEVKFMQKVTGKEPLILLDDLFAKLDDARSKQGMKLLDKNLQTIITTTDLKLVEQRGIVIDSKNNCSFRLD